MPPDDRAPLHGVTVVSLEHAVAAPHASRQLADLGARVIKIERVEGGDFGRDYDHAIGGSLSSVFLWTSRGKESVAIDLVADQGRRLLETLLATADVLLQNLAPGALSRLGFPIDELRDRFPQLIVVSNSGYGTSGPLADKRAYDALIQAESGITAATGSAEEMSKPGFSAADVAAGMFMFSAALTGLYQREKTGTGTIFDIAMLDSMVDAFSNHVYKSRHTGEATGRHGMSHPFAVPYGAFDTADGPIMVAVQNDREWTRFATLILGRPELAADPAFATNIARTTNRNTVDALVVDEFRTRSSSSVGAALDSADIAWSSIYDSLTVGEHPQFVDRGRWVTVGTPAGPAETLKNVISERGKDYRYGPVPALGEHTESVLAEAGFTAAEISAMRDSGTIA